MCHIQDYNSIVLDETHRRIVESELEMWHQNYLPDGKDLPPGSIVLDAGAGCGETAFFFLQHGAARVVSIEGDPKILYALRHNFGADPRVIIIPVMLSHLKIDIDGGEEGMLLETHFPFVLTELWQDGRSETRLWKLTRRSRY
jgi:hypothetical protein